MSYIFKSFNLLFCATFSLVFLCTFSCKWIHHDNFYGFFPCLSVCLCVCISVCLSVCRSMACRVCLSVCLSALKGRHKTFKCFFSVRTTKFLLPPPHFCGCFLTYSYSITQIFMDRWRKTIQTHGFYIISQCVLNLENLLYLL